MNQNEINELPKLDTGSFENIFNVYQDSNGSYFYNLLQTIQFPENLPSSLFKDYYVGYGDTWPFISYKTLGDPNIWWIILLANSIQNPLAPLINGTRIKIPNPPVIREILTQIRK
jgi:hypothetical protein